MSVKKKLAGGALAATMGLAMIGGGTFAAFNDIENVNATVEAGTLEMDLQALNGPLEFNISNLKPGDFAEREFKMFNTGSLAIKDVLLSIDKVTYTDGSPGDADIEDNTDVSAYLDQFVVTLVTVGAEGSSNSFPKDILTESDNITLADIHKASNDDADAIADVQSAVENSYASSDGRINIATINPDEWTGMPVIPDDPDNVKLAVKFKDDDDKDEQGYFTQNKFQGDSVGVTFTLEARQWDGLDIQDGDIENGVVETNKKANSEEGNTLRPSVNE